MKISDTNSAWMSLDLQSNAWSRSYEIMLDHKGSVTERKNALGWKW